MWQKQPMLLTCTHTFSSQVGWDHKGIQENIKGALIQYWF